MNFEKIKFKQESTQRVYNNYFKQIEKIVQPLPREEQLDLLMEMNSHIYEGMQKHSSKNELDYLLNTIDNFGDLEAVFKPIVAERKLDQATKTFNPAHIFKAMVLNIQNGAFFLFISFCYIGLGGFGIAILAKLIAPSEIGMYYKPGEYFVLAGIPGEQVNQEQYELLGDWYIPVMLLVLSTFYILITLTLRFEKYLKKKQELKISDYKSFNMHTV